MGDTLRYYDGPVLFTARDDLDRAYLATAIEDSAESARYLYIPITDNRLAGVIAGRVSLRAAFRDAGATTGFIVSSPFSGTDTSVEFVPLDDLSDAYLADPDVYLTDVVVDVPRFSPDELAEMARRDSRELLALELSGQQAFARARLPLSNVRVLSDLQRYADVIAAPVEYEMVQVQAASVVVILAPDFTLRGGPFIGYSETTGRIMDSLRSAASDSFDEFARTLQPRQRTRLRDFFAGVASAGAHLTAFAANWDGAVTQQSVTREQIGSSLQILRDTTLLEDETIIGSGPLIGINHVRRSFSVREVTHSGRRIETYSGQIAPDLAVENIPSGTTTLYRFTILRQQQIPEYDDDAVTWKNTLIGLEPLTGEHRADDV